MADELYNLSCGWLPTNKGWRPHWLATLQIALPLKGGLTGLKPVPTWFPEDVARYKVLATLRAFLGDRGVHRMEAVIIGHWAVYLLRLAEDEEDCTLCGLEPSKFLAFPAQKVMESKGISYPWLFERCQLRPRAPSWDGQNCLDQCAPCRQRLFAGRKLQEHLDGIGVA